jgi:hypothetical protein
MGRRREPRIKLDVQVKVCGMDTSGHPFVQTAYAVSISRTGVSLTGVGPLVRLGEVVVVLYKQRKARFRVVWIGEVGQPEFGQAGLEASDPNALIWDFPLPHVGKDGYELPDNEDVSAPAPPTAFSMPAVPTMASSFAPPPPSPATPAGALPNFERRNAPRFKCRGSAEIFIPSVSFPTRGQIDDISLSGVYIQTNAPLPIGNDVKLNLAVHGLMLQAQAQVRTAHPGVGMGLMFTSMTDENSQILSAVIHRLGGIPAPSGATPAVVVPATENTALRATTPAKWDALGREISEWFRSHENLNREEFYTMLRRI